MQANLKTQIDQNTMSEKDQEHFSENVKFVYWASIELKWHLSLTEQLI